MTKRSPLRAITTFGLGHLRPAPGTWGSLPPVVFAAAAVLAGLTHQTLRRNADMDLVYTWSPSGLIIYYGVLLLMLLGFGAACIKQGNAAEVRFGRKDPSQVVADETCGQCLPLLFLPAEVLLRTDTALFTIAFAFIAFRVMDIVKPWPANGLQRIPGGWGILIDDIVAGVYAMAIVQVVARAAI